MKTNVNFTPRQDLLSGVNTMANAVGSTLGPLGQNVAIAKTDYQGKIYARDVIHDGVKVAKSIDLSNEDENMGAQILKEAAQKQVDSVGDGTTVVMVLAQAILQEMFTLIAMGQNPMPLRRELEEIAGKIVEEIRSYAIPIASKKDVERIATISAQDAELGKLVALTLNNMGQDGIVLVEESKSAHTYVEHQDGMQIPSGYAHPLFLTNPDRLEAVSERARLLITDIPIPNFKPLIPLVTECHNKGIHLVVIAPEFLGDTLPTFLQNKMDGALVSLLVRAPHLATNQRDTLLDIATLTGAKMVLQDAGHKLEDADIGWLGSADQVVSTKSDTVIIGGKGRTQDINDRVKSIRQELETEESSFEQSKLKERLAKLTSGVSVIYVGGVTEIEMKERRERVEDSVQATKAAIRSGVVPGGEIVYLHARSVLNTETTMGKILFTALAKPFQKLTQNAGLDSGQLIERLSALTGKIDNVGIDVVDGQVKDMIQAGIIDPVEVPVNAVQNAVSVAVQIFTSSVVITPETHDVPKLPQG